MTELTEYAVVEREPPETMARNLRVASWLWSSATVFFFFAFLFAYFYLRALDQNHLWRPKHVDPSLTLGTLTTATLAGAAVLLRLGVVDHRSDRRPAWRVKGAAALVLLVASIALQVAEWSTQGFGPTDGGYASVYLGWTGLQLVFVLGLAFWLETTVATSIRYRASSGRAVAPGEASGDSHRDEPDIDDPVSLVRAQLEAVSVFAVVLASIAAVAWLLLYVL